MMLELLVVEDDPMLRDLLLQEISTHYQTPVQELRSASNLAEGKAALKQRLPDALLLDLSLPDGCGFELATDFINRKPDGRFIVLSGQTEHHVCPANLAEQLHAVVNKTEGLATLRKALWSLRSTAANQLPDITQLSPRQLEMLRLIGEGRDTLEIANIMGITFATAQTHRRQITSRLGVRGADLLYLARSLPLNET